MLQEENSERLKPFFMVVRLLSADKATMSFDTTPSVQHETMEKAIEEGRRLAKKHPSSQFAVLKSVALTLS